MTMSKILVVEPDDNIRNMLDIYLRGQGYQVMSFADDEGMIELARSHLPDVFLLADSDVISALNSSLYKKIRDLESLMHKPVIFLVDKYDIHITSADYSFPSFLEKPFKEKTLATMIKAAMIIYESNNK